MLSRIRALSVLLRLSFRTGLALTVLRFSLLTKSIQRENALSRVEMGSVLPVSAMMGTQKTETDAAASALLSKTSDVREEVRAHPMCANLRPPSLSKE